MFSSASVLRKVGCSRIPCSIMLFCPTTNARTCLQCGGIQRNARPLPIGRDHCHSARRAGRTARDMAVVKSGSTAEGLRGKVGNLIFRPVPGQDRGERRAGLFPPETVGEAKGGVRALLPARATGAPGAGQSETEGGL